MKIRGYDLTRAQRGWVCDVCFQVLTLNQSSAEEHTLRTGGRWMLTAIWNARRLARRVSAGTEATPAERWELCGWK